jgi:hypothetical protein
MRRGRPGRGAPAGQKVPTRNFCPLDDVIGDIEIGLARAVAYCSGLTLSCSALSASTCRTPLQNEMMLRGVDRVGRPKAVLA